MPVEDGFSSWIVCKTMPVVVCAIAWSTPAQGDVSRGPSGVARQPFAENKSAAERDALWTAAALANLDLARDERFQLRSEL